ncbi:MAG: ROK family transcriptional regulator [Spirochaetales bacterium]|nr:ROK family transcriptional regulator [Spirochaetales bacterium]
MKIVGNSNFQKAANTSLILNYLRHVESTSRSEMAQKLGLQPSTVTYIVERLEKGGILRTCAPPDTLPHKSGRKPVGIGLNPQFGQVIGLDLQADYYHAIITDIRGVEITSRRASLSPKLTTIQDRLLAAVEDLHPALDSQVQVLGMGLALPGVVDSNQRIVKDCWTHSLLNYSLGEFLDSQFTFPVVVENDANCCARHIQWSTEESEHEDCLYLLSKFHDRRHLPPNVPPIGIGLGLILGGKLHTGSSHEAGEYQSVHTPDSRVAHWQLSLENNELDHLNQDEEVRQRVVTELLGNMLFLMRILNPRVLHIGGNIGEWGALIQKSLETEYQEGWRPLKEQGCRIVPQGNSSSHPAHGAAACLLETLYAIPQVGQPGPERRIWNRLLGNLFDSLD